MNTFREGYSRQYLTKIYSYQCLFSIFVWYLIFALPFYFSFGGQNFWLKSKNTVMNLQYNYTGYYAIQLNYIQADTWRTQEYSNIIGSTMNTLVGLNQFQLVDSEKSSKLSFTLNSFETKQIINLNIILYYNVYIPELNKQISAAFVETISGNPSFVKMQGILRYEPQQELNSIDTNTLLNYPAYLPDLQPPTSFASLIDFITANPQVHRFDHQAIREWAVSKESKIRQFSIELSKDTKVNIGYFASVLERLKFAFSTWMGFWMIGYFVFYKLMGKLCRDGALVSKVRDQMVG